MIVAAVPVKDLVNAKQRLIPLLTPLERKELARAMLRDVLRALARADLDRVWVVTRDAEVTALARELGAEALVESANRGHTAAVALGRARALEAGARTFVTVPGDVPCATAEEVRSLVGSARTDAPTVALTPSRSGLGTNGAALSPPDAMPLTFGEPSFENHLRTAERLGLRPRVLPLPGLGLDIDAPEDLAALLAEGAGTWSGRLLGRWKIDDRLRAFGAPLAR